MLLECELTVERPEGELILDLAKGIDRFQAQWDLTTGECTLVRLTGAKEDQLDRKPTSFRGAGTYSLRFANVDERLMVWVNRTMPFGAGVLYAPAQKPGPSENDLQPADIGVRNAGVRVDKLQLWRDTYYSQQQCSANVPAHRH